MAGSHTFGVKINYIQIVYTRQYRIVYFFRYKPRKFGIFCESCTKIHGTLLFIRLAVKRHRGKAESKLSQKILKARNNLVIPSKK